MSNLTRTIDGVTLTLRWVAETTWRGAGYMVERDDGLPILVRGDIESAYRDGFAHVAEHYERDNPEDPRRECPCGCGPMPFTGWRTRRAEV